jgi:hypothetical protein
VTAPRPADAAASQSRVEATSAERGSEPQVSAGHASVDGANNHRASSRDHGIDSSPRPSRSSVGEPETPAQAETAGRLQGTLRVLLSIGANITVVTALVVFFGWKRAQAHAEMLGVSASIFGMSPQDYAFKSVDTLFPLLAVVAAVGLGWSRVHLIIARAVQQGRHPRLLDGTVRLLGLAWILVPGISVLLSWRFPQAGYLIFPLSFAVGLLLSCYGNYLRGQLQVARTGARPATPPPWHTSLTVTFVAVVVTLSLFWGVSNYATMVGDNLGRRLTSELPYQTQVVVYSPKRLELTAPNVREESLSGADAAYRFRYTGLRLLDHVGGKYFLVSDGWTPRYGVVIVLAETDPVRLEFVRDWRRPTQRTTTRG